MKRVLITLLLAFVIMAPAPQAAEKPVRFTQSKVDPAKNREREKLFTPWMKKAAFQLESATRQARGEKLLYFECEGAKDQWRGIFVPRVSQDTEFLFAIFGEKDAAQQIGEYLRLGFKPTFIVPRNNYFCFIVSKGAGAETNREELEKIGIGAPVIK